MKNKFLALLTMLALPILAFAEDKLDSGDTAWMMVSTAFVLLMTPAGLALFYAGMTMLLTHSLWLWVRLLFTL